EDSKTPGSLLRFCYPCTLAEDPVLEDFREVIDVLDAAKKYSLDAIQQAVRKSLFIPKILETNSLRCFAIACRTRMQDECELAAKYTLREPLILGWFEEIELITSAELLSLLTYHRMCSNAVYFFKRNLSWIPDELKQGHGVSCRCQHDEDWDSPALGDWWQAFIDSTFFDLWDKPCAEMVQLNIEKTIHAIRQRGCNKCRKVAPGRLREVNILFTRKVEEVTSKVTTFHLHLKTSFT
ncbi:hypothetical protein F5J12DRAFT_726960, partial [Pisolithus orientalis]|uniref:uncharacterized protein n=1 Tax=Pisolithus orientalis TaxID=936130 RepID=UPI0022245FAC